MPELRWTLLILGALFIGGLALWEWRRQRHARGPADATAASAGHGGREGGERVSPTFDSDSGASFDASPTLNPARGVFREPTIGLPDEPPPQVTNDSRERIADPPVVEFDEEQMDGLKVEGEAAVDELGAAGRALQEDRPVAPLIPHLSAPAAAPVLAPAEEPRVSDQHNEPTMQFDASEPEPSLPAASVSPGADPFAVLDPIVEWPEEDSRKIIALRLVSGIGERFAGRAIRQALAAEGFVLGKFDIFHKPGPDGRAVLSAASLTKPGTFAVDTMDAQRFGGISLFAVLPGPLSPVATFDELMTSARALNDRLRGALQDERGEPLTPMRSQSLRESLAATATAEAPIVRAATAPPTIGSGATPH
jgi:FtsZ-interacting cell division protein ZipA